MAGRSFRGGLVLSVLLFCAAHPSSALGVVRDPGLVGADDPPLIEAARNREWDVLTELLVDGADANVTTADGTTALHWASYWDDVAAAATLLEAGADADAANDLGATPLWNAALNGSAEMTLALLFVGADPNAPLLSGETSIMTAARTGDPEVVAVLLEAGADPNARATRGQTALMWAAAQRHPEAVRVLIEHGADVHARSETWSQVMAISPHSDPSNQQNVPHGGNTALLFAARVGDAASARHLLDAGADPDDTDARGVSATTLAAHSGFGAVVELLLEAGADPDAAGAGFAALHVAIMRRDEAVVSTILAHGADPNVRVTNWTATRRASADWHFHPALVGATPFWLAARFTQPGVMRLLAEHGADPLFVHNADYVGAAGTFGAVRRAESTTALMAAVGMGGPRRMSAFMAPDRGELEALTLEAVKVAVEFGIDVDAVDEQGRTAADAARLPAVVDFLTGVGSRR
mgnify:FL=1|jgi:ankyrin repeat protein